MVRFTTTILKFDRQGEKTGWTYILIPARIASRIQGAQKKSFRVKGRLDQFPIQGIALLPMGEGDFIMALNAALRKGIGKSHGAGLVVEIEADERKKEPPAALLECLADEPAALAYFNSLSQSHRNYFGSWIMSAKTESTRATRIAKAVNALARGMDFGKMMRYGRDSSRP